MTLRILLTGATPTQVGSTRTRVGAWCIPQALREGFGGLEVEAEQRPLADDDFPTPAYDLVVLGLASPGGFAGRYVNYTLRLLGEWERSPFPLVVMYDDWNAGTLMANYRFLINRPDRVARKAEGLGYVGGREFAEAHHDRIIAGATLGAEGRWPPFLLQRFAWGDPRRMLEQVGVPEGAASWSLDPSPLMPAYPFSPPEHRRRAWTCPRLQTRYDAWIAKVQPTLTWPVLTFGNKRVGEWVVPESQVPQVVSESWGSLGPASMAPGSGMWRSRFQIAARTRTPMFMDPAEVSELGPAFGVTSAELEAMTDPQLAALAEAQAEAVTGRLWARAQFFEALADLVRDVTGTRPGVRSCALLAPAPAPTKVEVKAAPGGSKPVAGRNAALHGPVVRPLKPVAVEPVRPATEYRQLDVRDDDYVLDVGAHHGEFLTFVRSVAPGATVTCFEADDTNFTRLQSTVGGLTDVVISRSAVVDYDDGSLTELWLCGGADTSMHSLVPRRGRQSQLVSTFPWRKALLLEPTVVKLAVEGYELALLQAAPLPQSVRSVAIKFHPSTDRSRLEAAHCRHLVEQQGFTCVQEPWLERGSWPVVGVWRRHSAQEGGE